MMVIDNCCGCEDGNTPRTCYSNKGTVRKHFAGTTNSPNHWSSPYLKAYRVAVSCDLEALPTDVFNSGVSFEVIVRARPVTEIARGDELGEASLCRLSGNTPSRLVDLLGNTYDGGDRSFLALGGVITHRTTSLRIAGWNGVDAYTGDLMPVRNRDILMHPKPGVDPWGYYWRVTVTRHREENHDYGGGFIGDYYWTTVEIEDALLQYKATYDSVAWAYSYQGGTIPPHTTSEDVDLRDSVLKPEDATTLLHYNPSKRGSVAQSPTTLNAQLPRFTTVARSVRASVRLTRTLRSDGTAFEMLVPNADLSRDYYVRVEEDSGERARTGQPYEIIGAVYYEKNRFTGEVTLTPAGWASFTTRVWPYLDIVSAGAVEVVAVDVSNTSGSQRVALTAFYANGSEIRLEIELDWLGVQTTGDFLGDPWGKNASGCYEDGMCSHQNPTGQWITSCEQPCYTESIGVVFSPHLNHTMLDYGWKVTQAGQCPVVPTSRP